MSSVAIDFARLCEELRTLNDAPAARDEASRARVERTLTDGYAHAMSLEADRLRQADEASSKIATWCR